MLGTQVRNTCRGVSTAKSCRHEVILHAGFESQPAPTSPQAMSWALTLLQPRPQMLSTSASYTSSAWISGWSVNTAPHRQGSQSSVCLCSRHFVEQMSQHVQ